MIRQRMMPPFLVTGGGLSREPAARVELWDSSMALVS